MIEKILLAIGDLGPLYLLPIWKPFWRGMVESQVLAGALPIFIGALIAIPYFRMKDYEYIQRRYISRIEGLIDYFHELRITLEENHTHTLQTLQFFRDFDIPSFKKWYENKSVDFEKISPKMPQDFLIAINLLGSEKIGRLCIENFATCSALNEVYISQIPIRIREALEGDTSQFNDFKTREEISNNIADDLGRQRKGLDKIKLYSIPEQFEEILIEAKKMRLDRYKNLPELKNNAQVIQAIKTMEAWLDDLERTKKE